MQLGGLTFLSFLKHERVFHFIVIGNEHCQFRGTSVMDQRKYELFGKRSICRKTEHLYKNLTILFTELYRYATPPESVHDNF
jgi:hypothetical protein